jgi:hypothetical protein
MPGRHHTLTRDQAAWLASARAGTLRDRSGHPIELAHDAILVLAITSANHAATRRNPVSAAQRVAQAELFLHIERIPGAVVAIPDLPVTDQFAARVIADVAASPGIDIPINPSTTLVAVSTPVGEMYAALGYRIGGVELDMPGAPYPWDLVEAAAAGNTATFHAHAHPATIDVWSRYSLLPAVSALFADAVVAGEDGGLTSTRDYRPYAEAFEATAARKWAEIRDTVIPGAFLDVGCASGAMLVEAGRDPLLAGHPIHGVEADRWLHAEAQHKLEQGGFPSPMTFLRRGNILTPGLYPPASIMTTVTAALTHEIYSYGDGDADLAALVSRIADHTAPGGVWINSDLAAPDDADRIVRMTLSTDDGAAPLVDDSDTLSATQLAGELAEQSTATRFLQYARDRRRRSTTPRSPSASSTCGSATRWSSFSIRTTSTRGIRNSPRPTATGPGLAGATS